VRIDDFDYELPEVLIAQRPAEARSQSRLLCLPPDGGPCRHHRFAELPGLLRPGDLLVLTKALGTGAVTTAAKNGACPSGFLGSAIKSMKRLNDRALDALAAHGVRACTDVTGFSFAGHALEIAKKSGVGLRVFAGSLPYLDGAAELAAAGHLPGGAGRNRRCFEPSVSYGGGLGEEFRKLFYVPETSGGLLGALPPGNAAACVRVLRDCGHDAAIVGAVTGPAAAPALELEAGAFRA